MSLSRRQKKDLKRFRGSAEELWHDQQAVLERANLMLKDASKQAAVLTREEVLPRAKGAYDSRLKPSVDAGRTAVVSASNSVVKTVVPAVGSAVGAALAVADAANDARAKVTIESIAAKAGVSPKTVKKAKKAASSGRKQLGSAVAKATKGAKRSAPTPAKKSGIGPIGVIGIVVGIAAAVGIAYAVWQTLRADDDLWVADDEPTTPAA